MIYHHTSDISIAVSYLVNVLNDWKPFLVMAYVWSNSMSLFFSAPSNVSTIIHILYLPEDAKGENVHFQWKQDYLHAGEVYEACWALDNILIINAAHRKVVLEDNLDPVDTGNWLFFPGATVKVSLNIYVYNGLISLLLFMWKDPMTLMSESLSTQDILWLWSKT